MDRALNVLLIVHGAALRAGTIREHVDALTRLSRHQVVRVDCSVAHTIDFAAFDAIALHYSLVIASPAYISPRLGEKIARFSGLKLLFIQDEYRWIDATARAIHDLGISVVFSLIDPKIVRKVYCHPFLGDVRFEFTLAGFVSRPLVDRRVPEYQQRRIDVGYRARKLSPWYGVHALQKWQIAEAFVDHARPFGLNLDISTSEADRIYGRRWIRFLADCKACLGTESGASVLDYTDDIRRAVEAYLVDRPKAEFDELRDRFFRDIDGKVLMNVISPRCFEAAALRSLMVMYPGEYGGFLDPGRHYVVLEPDHSNIEEVVATIRSPARAGAVIARAYSEIACCEDFGFAALARHFDRVIDERGHMVRVAGLTPDPGWRLRLREMAAGQAAWLRLVLAQRGIRWERRLLAMARTRLPDRLFDRLEGGLRLLRLTAKKWIIGAG